MIPQEIKKKDSHIVFSYVTELSTQFLCNFQKKIPVLRKEVRKEGVYFISSGERTQFLHW